MTAKVLRLLPLILLAAACNRQDGENQADAAPAAPATAAAPQTAQAAPPPLTRDAVEGATFSAQTVSNTDAASPAVLKAQILLDRTRFSPGVIDGKTGGNTTQAIAAFEAENGLPSDGQLDEQVFAKLTQLDNRPVLADYEISAQDVAGPFVASIPQGDYEAQSKLPALSFTSPLEMLAEKFHMTEEALQALNPGADFAKAGQRLVVPVVAGPALAEAIESIDVDKGARAVRVMGAGGKLLAYYPATIGSDEMPSPEGNMTVRAVAPEPTYTFDPSRLNWDGAKGKVTVKPGPNNPVGSVWIDLTKDTYGIHGTPDPRYVAKRPSHGCVRLTNWDAEELAAKVKAGVPVRFVTGGSNANRA